MKPVNIRRRIEMHRWLRSDGKPNFSTRIHKHDSELKYAGIKEVIKSSPHNSVLRVSELMYRNNIRAVPITDSEDRILGLVTAMDLVNYFGGGDYFNIVKVKYGGNIYKALNENIGSIMKKDPATISVDRKLTDLLELMVLSGYGVIPIVDDENRVVGIVTERDIVNYLSSRISLGVKIKDLMTKNVITIREDKSIKDVLQLMVSAGIRRLPIVDERDVVTGIVTAKDVVNVVGSHKIFSMAKTGNIEEFLNAKISEISTSRVVTVSPNDDLSTAIGLMSTYNVSGLLVTENGTLVGIITERDVIYALVTK